MFVMITKVEPMPDMKLKLEFSDGRVGIVDLSSMQQGRYATLKNPEVFDKVKIEQSGRSLGWEGIDVSICADGLYWKMFGALPESYKVVDTLKRRKQANYVKYAGVLYRRRKEK